jgi:hypothetical protein
MMRIKLVFATLFVLLFAHCKKDKMIDKTFWLENIGSRTDLPFLPDASVNYYGYSFLRNRGDKIGIRLKGKYGYARYMSFNIYNNNNKTSSASLRDVEIVADNGHLNPFTNLSQTDNRNYTVHILPDIAEAQSYSNKLLYNDSITNLGTFLRYYVPEINNTANVPLPEIEAFNIITGEILPTPEPLNIDFTKFTKFITAYSKIIDITFLLQKSNSIEFFRFSGAGLYQNFDNKYLFAPVVLNKDEVIMFRFIPPTYVKNIVEIPEKDVRYYSICLGDSKTYNYVTHQDYKLKIAADGFINVVIGRKDDEVIAKAAGLNFIEWVPELKNKGLVVYRNLLTRPDYEYSLTKVPDLLENINEVFNTPLLYASTYLGNHAPSGVKMSKEQFLENFGNYPVSY